MNEKIKTVTKKVTADKNGDLLENIIRVIKAHKNGKYVNVDFDANGNKYAIVSYDVEEGEEV